MCSLYRCGASCAAPLGEASGLSSGFLQVESFKHPACINGKVCQGAISGTDVINGCSRVLHSGPIADLWSDGDR